MRKNFIPFIIGLAILLNTSAPADAGIVTTLKAQISKNREEKAELNEIKQVFQKQLDYTNTYRYDKLYEIYAPNFINSDGIDKKIYFKLIKDTWETYPDITYNTYIKNIVVNNEYAYVETYETAVATANDSTELIEAVGELHSASNCIYYLQKIQGKWLITSENIIDEKSELKYGDARYIDIDLDAPAIVNAGQEYTASLQVYDPDEHVIIASINREKNVYPQTHSEDNFRPMPDNNMLERIFKANTDNINEYCIASLGFTKSDVHDKSQLRVYITGLAFIITRVNVIPKNNFITVEEKNEQKTK